MRKLARLLKGKPLKEAKKNDLVDVVSSVGEDHRVRHTKRTEKECIRCFYRWLKGGDDGDEYPA
ncbi:MAG: hypothetical protein ACRECH_04600 [Nitrososphaerales archaeon]